MSQDEFDVKVSEVLNTIITIRLNRDGGYDEDRSARDVLTAFGRECAREARAKAFMEAAKMVRVHRTTLEGCKELENKFLLLASGCVCGFVDGVHEPDCPDHHSNDWARANPPAPCAECGGLGTVGVSCPGGSCAGPHNAPCPKCAPHSPEAP